MRTINDQQQRVLGRVLAQSVHSDYAAAAKAAGGTLPNLDSGSGASTHTGGPYPLPIDIRVNRDWPTA
ncbi:MAG: hypothetical protein SGI99_06665 [Pseudomonadota bacterium]|nr:hypothetical protein [Pseudomonadota bacterium]